MRCKQQRTFQPFGIRSKVWLLESLPGDLGESAFGIVRTDDSCPNPTNRFLELVAMQRVWLARGVVGIEGKPCFEVDGERVRRSKGIRDRIPGGGGLLFEANEVATRD